jgi:hypothetical protein
MTDEEISEVVSGLLHQQFADLEFDHSTVASEEDYDGSSIIRVVAHFRDGPVPAAVRLIDAGHDIRTELIKRGDERFVFLDVAFPNDHEFIDEDFADEDFADEGLE